MTGLRKLRVGIAVDDVGEELKRQLLARLQDHPCIESLRDYSYTFDDEAGMAYPTAALTTTEVVKRDEVDRAVLICGTGIGMCITANKVLGARAAVGHESYWVERSIRSNNCQVLALGSRIVAPTLACRLLDEWLGYDFDEQTPSAAKLHLLDQLEQELQIDRPSHRESEETQDLHPER